LCSVCIETNPLVPLVLTLPPPKPSHIHSAIKTMSESPKYSWQKCSNANTHPADVLLNMKQKHCTPAKKAAADKAKASKDKEGAIKAKKDHCKAVAQIVKLEDAIQQEDKVYPIITSEIGPCKPNTANHDPEYHDMDMSNLESKGIATKENVPDSPDLR
jgi:hypothetical protein